MFLDLLEIRGVAGGIPAWRVPKGFLDKVFALKSVVLYKNLYSSYSCIDIVRDITYLWGGDVYTEVC